MFYNLYVSVWDRIRVVVFNATFNNISVILWWPVLLVEEAGVPRENHMSVYVQGKKPNVTARKLPGFGCIKINGRFIRLLN